MKNSLVYLALILALFGTACRPGQDDKSLDVAQSADVRKVDSVTSNQPSSPAELMTIEGELCYEDLEGGTWRIVTNNQSWVLRTAAGSQDFVATMRQNCIRAGSRVIIQGYPASAENNIGINMAGPYFEVISINVIK